ncbi:MAG: hypothetical protein PVI03_07475 [Candidatus Thorarchaeota archaeon]|jgi:hypothetical protein
MSSNGKPTVHFDMNAPYSITTGGRAFIMPLDHPSDDVSNESVVTTSIVERIHCEPGQVFFETANTYYRGVHVARFKEEDE